MQASESLSLGELVKCSICLETYTNPKMLPCQHTYCYSCLLYLTVNRTNIRCPQCRELHDLPPTGVKGFKEHLVINNLLSLASPREEAECSDCQLPLPVSCCDHCEQNICVECRVKHTKLSFEIDLNLKSLQESITTEEYGKKISAHEEQYFERCLDKLQKEQGRMETVFEKEIDRLVKLLITRRQYFEQYFAVIAGLYRSVIRAKAGAVEPPSFVEDFSRKLRHCKTVESLQELKNDLSDLTNVARLVERREDDFKFVNESLTLEIETFGRVEFGEAVVGIRGKYDTVVTPTEQAIERSNESDVAGNVPINTTTTKSSGSGNGNTARASTSTNEMVDVMPAMNMTIPDLAVQKCEIAQLLETALKKGDTWYLLDAKWFKQWKKYVGFDAWDSGEVGKESVWPGFVDNGSLLKDGTSEVKDHLIEELDYVLLPIVAWDKLVQWYSLRDNQQPIERHVIEQGMFVKQCKVEVYLMDLKLFQNSEIENVQVKQFSRADKIEVVEKEMRSLFCISEAKNVRLWNRYMTNTYEHLDKPHIGLQDAGLYQGQLIVIEQQNDDGSWPRQTK